MERPLVALSGSADLADDGQGRDGVVQQEDDRDDRDAPAHRPGEREGLADAEKAQHDSDSTHSRHPRLGEQAERPQRGREGDKTLDGGRDAAGAGLLTDEEERARGDKEDPAGEDRRDVRTAGRSPVRFANERVREQEDRSGVVPEGDKQHRIGRFEADGDRRERESPEQGEQGEQPDRTKPIVHTGSERAR